MIEDVAAKYACPVIKAKVGQSHIIQALLSEEGSIAGEGSGGVAVRSFQPAFDGFLAMGLVLEAMAAGGKKLSGLIQELPKYHIVKEKIYCPPSRVHSVMDGVEKLIEKDGPSLNGGVIWPRVHTCRDSFTAIGLILEALATSARPVSDLARKVPHYVMIKDKVPGTPEEARRVLSRLKKAYAKEDVSMLDGLKINFGYAWVHIRPSNTEPIIRVLAETKTEDETRRLLDEFKTKLGSNLLF